MIAAGGQLLGLPFFILCKLVTSLFFEAPILRRVGSTSTANICAVRVNNGIVGTNAARSRSELDRFRLAAFWRLDHYNELSDHLRSQYNCILENDRLVIFDLQDLDLKRAE